MSTCGQRSHQLLGTSYPATTAASIPSPSIVITSQPQPHLMFCRPWERTIVFYIDRSSVLSPENDFIPGAFNSPRGSGMTEGKIPCSSTNQEKSKRHSSENRQKLSPLQKLFQTITKAMLFVNIAWGGCWQHIGRDWWSTRFPVKVVNYFWREYRWHLGAVSIRKTVLLGMAIPMLKIRRPLGRLIFNMGIAIPGFCLLYFLSTLYVVAYYRSLTF